MPPVLPILPFPTYPNPTATPYTATYALIIYTQTHGNPQTWQAAL